MLGPLSRFKVPSVSNEKASTLLPSILLATTSGERIRIDPDKIPNYVWNQDGSGYGAMFSSEKLALNRGPIFPKV